MKHILSTIGLLALCGGAFAQSIERPAVKVGDECAHDVFDNLSKDASGGPEKIAERRGVVTAVDGDRITMQWTQKILVTRDTEDLEDGTWLYDKDLNVVDRNGRKYEPPFPGRVIPLAPGATVKGAKSTYQRIQRDGTNTVDLDAKVTGPETVTVPAGKFDALTVTWEGWYTVNRTQGARATGRLFQQLAFAANTHCLVSGTYRTYRTNGGIFSDRTVRLTSMKQ